MTDFLLTALLSGWDVLVESAPYILFGLVAAGLLKVFLPQDLVARHLAGGRLASILKASLAGIPLPLCSCSVLPAAAALRDRGARKGAVASFLVSTPETGVDSISVTYALLDPIMTVLRPVAAFLTAIVAGFFVEGAERGTGTRSIPAPTFGAVEPSTEGAAPDSLAPT
jgi:hypothetical protein